MVYNALTKITATPPPLNFCLYNFVTYIPESHKAPASPPSVSAPRTTEGGASFAPLRCGSRRREAMPMHAEA